MKTLKYAKWAAEQSCDGLAGKCLLFALAGYADMQGTCFVSQVRLAKVTQMSERSVRTWLKHLEAKGLISRSRGGREGIQATVYQLSMSGPKPVKENAREAKQ